MPDAPPPYATVAWLLDGPISSVVGILQWTGDRLEFIAFDVAALTSKGLGKLLERFDQPAENAKRIIDGHPAIVFSAQPADVRNYKFPWYSFKKGVHLTLFDRVVKFSLIEPQNTQLPPQLIGWSASKTLSGTVTAQVPAKKADSKRWQEIFEHLKG